MKNLIIFTLVLISFNTYSQDFYLFGVDTLKGADTLEFRTSAMAKNEYFAALQADFEYISDLSINDSIHSETSINDISYARLTPLNYNVFGFPGTKSSINNISCILINTIGIVNPYFGFTAYGVAGDTTVIKVYGLIKK